MGARRLGPSLGLSIFLLGGCGPPPGSELGQVGGSIQVVGGLFADVYLFLFQTGNGAPVIPAPAYVSAVSQERLARGDGHYVFAPVVPGTYRLGGFLDVNGSFRPDIDVLAQPRAGDWLAQTTDLSVVANHRAALDVGWASLLAHEPPAFEVEGHRGDAIVVPSASPIASYNLISAAPADLDPVRTRFAASLGPAPQVFLRRSPGGVGGEAEVVVPCLYNPFAFLSAPLSPDGREQWLGRLPITILPTAFQATLAPGGGLWLRALPSIPLGDYELWVTEGDVFWKVPNDLGNGAWTPGAAPSPSQATRFKVQ